MEWTKEVDPTFLKGTDVVPFFFPRSPHLDLISIVCLEREEKRVALTAAGRVQPAADLSLARRPSWIRLGVCVVV